MLRFGAIFIALCILVMSSSLGAILYLALGFTGSEAVIAAVAALSALSLLNAVTTRVKDTSNVSGQIADLSRGTADLARQVGEIGRRVAAVETDLGRAAARTMAATEPLSAEIGILGSLVKQLADSVAAHETALVRQASAVLTPAAVQPVAASAAPGAAAPSVGPVEPARMSDRTELGEPEPIADAAKDGPFKGLTREETVAVLRRAIDANRIDLYLQPIVTLPQRKVRYYEAMTRLRGDDGEVLLPADFVPFAEAGNLMPAIDNLMLFRCVQVVRRLQTKNREIGLFCNMSASTLNHSAIFAQVSDFLDANRALAPSIVLEFSQATIRDMGPIEHESLAALADLGFRFSMNRMSDLHLDPREFADRGFRYVKAPAALLLSRPGTASDIHPADFSDLLGRFGIDLIAEKIESEGTVIDLLDFDVRFGQGFLFSPPRPVRNEVLQGISDRPLPGRPGAREDASPVRGPEPLGEQRPATERRSGSAQLAREVIRRA